jgi:hypothetical protein
MRCRLVTGAEGIDFQAGPLRRFGSPALKAGGVGLRPLAKRGNAKTENEKLKFPLATLPLCPCASVRATLPDFTPFSAHQTGGWRETGGWCEAG